MDGPPGWGKGSWNGGRAVGPMQPAATGTHLGL